MAWERGPEYKVGILIPSTGLISVEWAASLAGLVAGAGLPTRIYVNKHYRVDFSRNDLVESALRDGCSHLLFLDSDTYPWAYDPGRQALVPSTFTIPILLSNLYPIVSGLYWTKTHGSNLYTLASKDPVQYRPINGPLELFGGRKLFVDGVGIGCCMIDRRVFERLEYPWFEYRRRVENGKKYDLSEDLGFCLAARAAGFAILADGIVICKHEAKTFLTWNDQADVALSTPKGQRVIDPQPTTSRPTEPDQ